MNAFKTSPIAHLLGIRVKAAARSVLPRKPAPAATAIAPKPPAKARTTTADVVLAERQRMRTIVTRGIEIGAIRFASTLAFKTDMSAQLAIDSLEVAKLDLADTAKAQRFTAPLPAARTHAAPSAKQQADQILAAAAKARPQAFQAGQIGAVRVVSVQPSTDPQQLDA
jgi:hypothetical protein